MGTHRLRRDGTPRDTTTFMVMAYIIFVNPLITLQAITILGLAGMALGNSEPA